MSEIDSIEVEKLRLEQSRYRAEIVKWIIVAVAAIISFIVIDIGKLHLEESRATNENRRELMNAYLRATESPEPDVWKRKLNIILNSTDDDQTTNWANAELEYIDQFAALDVLYRETIKVASQLVNPNQLDQAVREQERARFEQLYWADLPFAGESSEVAMEMVNFRNDLLKAESEGQDSSAWAGMNRALIDLATKLKDSMPKWPSSRSGS